MNNETHLLKAADIQVVMDPAVGANTGANPLFLRQLGRGEHVDDAEGACRSAAAHRRVKRRILQLSVVAVEVAVEGGRCLISTRSLSH